MNRKVATALFSVIFVVSLLSVSTTVAYSDFNPTPDIGLATNPIFMSGRYPGNMEAVPAANLVVFSEMSSGLCCTLLENTILFEVSACPGPNGAPWQIDDDALSLVSDPTYGGESFLPGVALDFSDAGCSAPIHGTPIEVKVSAQVEGPLNDRYVGVNEWTFFTTGSSSTPPPASNQEPEFELTAVNPTPLVPGQTRLVSGKGLTSSTRVLFNTGEVPNTSFNSTTSRITFLVPEGVYCGLHTVQLRNPGGDPEYSNIKEYTITRNCVDPDPDEPPQLIIVLPPPNLGDEDPGLAIDSLFPDSGSPGTVVIINGSGFLNQKSYVLFDGEIMQTGEYLSDEQMRFTIPPGTPCQKLPVQIQNDLLVEEFSNEVDFAVIQPCGSQSGSGNPPGEDPPSDDPPSEDPPPPNNPPTPPPGGGEEIEDYDSNGDCRIDNNEFFGAVDLWISGSIDNGVFFAVLDAWISESDICGASASTSNLLEIELLQRPSGHVIFGVQSDGAISMQRVEIYNLQGELIFSDRSMGRALSWNMRLNGGARVANGLYLYRIEALDHTGQRLSSAVRKLVVLN